MERDISVELLEEALPVADQDRQAGLSDVVGEPAPLFVSQRFGGVDAQTASGRAQRSETADVQHEHGRAGQDAGDRQAADLLDRHVPVHSGPGLVGLTRTRQPLRFFSAWDGRLTGVVRDCDT